MKVKCEKCGGAGHEAWDEDGRSVLDVCYRCGGTGKVEPEVAHETLVSQVCAVLAQIAVQAERRSCNSDPEGEGWAFRAAENMMTEHDYTQSRMYDREAEFEVALATVPHALQSAMIEALLPKPKAEPEAAPAPKPAAPQPESDDLPF